MKLTRNSRRACPSNEAPRIVHGDYRMGNFLSNGADGRVEAVLDWELCTLGDPPLAQAAVDLLRSGDLV